MVTVVKIIWFLGTVLFITLGIVAGMFWTFFFAGVLPYTFYCLCLAGVSKPFDERDKILADFRKKNPNLFKDDD